MITAHDFADYIECYTSRDYTRLAERWYTASVEYEGFGTIQGIDNVLEYFRSTLHRGQREKYSINRLAIDGATVGVELGIDRTYTESMEAPLGWVAPGDRYSIRLLGVYSLVGDRIDRVSLARLSAVRLPSATQSG